MLFTYQFIRSMEKQQISDLCSQVLLELMLTDHKHIFILMLCIAPQLGAVLPRERAAG